MPAAVLASMNPSDILDDDGVRRMIIDAYIADMSKYATGSDSVKIRGAYESMPAQLSKDNKKFRYKLIKSGARSAVYGDSIDWLLESGLVLKCQKVEHGYMPPKAYEDLSSFKLYMGDVGLLCKLSGVNFGAMSREQDRMYLGGITENYVACALVVNGLSLMYWESKGRSEIDFVIVNKDGVIPVEVKTAINNKSKSLSTYREKYKPPYAIRISKRNFGFDNQIKSVPLYAVFCISP